LALSGAEGSGATGSEGGKGEIEEVSHYCKELKAHQVTLNNKQGFPQPKVLQNS
jgi:hypothetical protein